MQHYITVITVINLTQNVHTFDMFPNHLFIILFYFYHYQVYIIITLAISISLHLEPIIDSFENQVGSKIDGM